MKSSKRIDYMPGLFNKYKAEPKLDNWCYEFPEVMWALGYEMDCCHSFETYADNCKLNIKTPKNDRKQKRNILYMLEHADWQIVGNYLFSYWRYLTHWAMYGPSEYEVDFVMRIIKILEDKYACEIGVRDISENVNSINKVVIESVVSIMFASSGM